MSIFSRELSTNECAIVVQRDNAPSVIRGPARVRTFWRWKRVVVIDHSPLALDVFAKGLLTGDQVPVSVCAQVDARVIDPVAAATKVVDFRKATQMLAETA